MSESEVFEICVGFDASLFDQEKIRTIVRARHNRCVDKGFIDGIWEDSTLETYVIAVSDIAEAVFETVELIKLELNIETVAVLDSEDLLF